MAGNKVTKDSIFEGDAFAEALKSLTNYQGGVLVLDKAYDALIAKLGQVKEALEGIGFKNSKDIDNYKKAIKEGVDVEATAIKTKKAITQATEEEIKARLKSQAAIAAQKKELKDVIVLEDKETGTLAKLRAENSQLTRERDKLNLSTKEGQTRLKEINDALDKNNAFIKTNSDQLTQQRLNVGNYSDSIKDAFGKLGLFGDAFEKLRRVQETGVAFLKLLTIGQKANTDAVAENTIAVEGNTVATELQASVGKQQVAAEEAGAVATDANTIAVELNTSAVELNSAAVEGNIIALEAEEGATVKLSTAKKVLNAISSPTGLIIAAGVAAIKVLYDNATATQIAKDRLDALEEAAAKGASKIDVFGRSASGTAEKIYDLVLAEKALHDQQEANLPLFEKLRADAAEARTEAEKENVTTQEKIKLIGTYIDKQTQLSALQRDEKIKEFAKSLGLVQTTIINDEIVATYDLVKAEQILQRTQAEGGKIRKEDFAQNTPRLRANIDAADQAAQAVVAIDTELNSTLRRATKRRTTLIEQDEKDRRTLIVESQKRQAEVIKEEKQKQIAEENIRFEAELFDTKDKQKKLGAIRVDENGIEVDDTKKFLEEIKTIRKLHTENILEIEKRERDRVSQIRKEIQLDEVKDRAGDAEKLVQLYLKDYEQTNTEILERGKLFNKKSQNLRTEQFEFVIANLTNETVLKEEQLKLQAEKDEENVKNSIKNAEIKAEELKKIEKKLKIDLDNLHDDQAKKESDLRKKKSDDDVKITKEQIKEELRIAKEITSQIGEELQRRNELTNDSFNRQIDLAQKGIDRQTQLAAAGKANDLDFEKGTANKLELQRKENLERQQKQQEAIKLADIILSSVNNKVNAGEPFAQALPEAVGEAFAVKAIAKSIAGAFIDGTDGSKTVEETLGKPQLKGRDGYIIRADGKERIFSPGDSSKLGNLTNAEIAAMAMDYNSGRYLPKYAMETGFTARSTGESISNSLMLQQYAEMNKKLDYLEKIAAKPDLAIDWDSNGNMRKKEIHEGMATVVTIMKARPRI